MKHTNISKSIFAAVVLFTAIGVWAETWKDPDTGYTWSYRIVNGGAEICKSYDMATVTPSPTGAMTIPYMINGYSVTVIGHDAFSGCSGLTSVTIPASVTAIGSGSFSGCGSLRSAVIPVSVKTIGSSAFRNCTSLQSISLPVSVSSVEYNTFEGCTSLGSVDLPVTIKSIGSSAFYGCVLLSSLKIPFSVKTIGDRAFYGCSTLSNLELANGIETISYEAFYGCGALQEVVIPPSVTSIGSSAFGACGNVRRVTIPECMVNGYCSLQNVFGDVCQSITSVTIAEGCESIGSSAFYSCSGVTSISIPASVSSIDSYALRNCTSLTDITVASGNQNYKFVGGMLLTKDGTQIVAVPSGRTWVSIPDSVTSVSPSVFNTCPNLNFSWSNGVKSIDGWVIDYDADVLPKNLVLNGYCGIAKGAFEYCDSLIGVTIGEGVKAIGDTAFGWCYSLSSVSIPASVKKINEEAFYACYNLKTISLAKNNTAYKFENNLLVSTDNTKLIAVSRNATSVAIPNGVTSVPDHFFAGCSKLTSVTIPTSVESICDEGNAFTGWAETYDVNTDEDIDIFYGCPALKTISVAAGNPYYKSINGMLLGIDDDDLYLEAVPQSLTSMTVPEGVRWISDGVFAGCAKLTSVTLPRSLDEFESEDLYDWEFDGSDESSGPYKLTSIKVAAGNEEFSSANGLLLSKDGAEIICVPRGLTSVTIPASVTSVEFAFDDCFKIRSFNVEKGNASYSAFDGMLLSKDGTELVCVPAALKTSRSISIPAGIKRIDSGAFSDFALLTSVAIPEGVAEICDYAFSGCESLAKITLPATLTKIGRGAFKGCQSLTSINIPDNVMYVGAEAFVLIGGQVCCGMQIRPDYGSSLFDTNSIPGFVLVDGWLVDVINPLDLRYGDPFETTEYINAALQNPCVRGVAGGVFENCRSLLSIELPQCMKYIGYGTFTYGYNLESVSIPDSVRGIARNAFYNCNECIDRDSIPGLEIVDGWILKDKGISSYLLQDEYFDGELVISGEDGIRGVADGAFAGGGHRDTPASGCSETATPGLVGVKSLVIGDGVTAIGESSFAVCDDLTNVYVSASVKYIGEKAFYDCRGLQSVMLPDTLKGKIPDSAFAKCPTQLKVSYYEAPRPMHSVIFRDNYTKDDSADDPPEQEKPLGIIASISAHNDADGWTNWYWKTAVTVPRGASHTFMITGLTGDTAITDIEVYCEYAYQEDGETREDCVYASELCEIENSNGGWDKCVFLTADDWEWVPSHIKDLTFTVWVLGCGDEACSAADRRFVFSHSAGIVYSADYAPMGSLENPICVIPSETAMPSEDSARLTCALGGECFIKVALTAGRKYVFGIGGGDDLSFDLYDEHDTLSVNTIAMDGWADCLSAFAVVPDVSGSYIVGVSGSASSEFTFYSAVLPRRHPSEHMFTDLHVGVESLLFSPGYLNSPESGMYDDVIDQHLFRVVGYHKDDNVLFSVEGAEVPLLMRLYDKDGRIIAERTSNDWNFDVSIAWTAAANYSATNAVYIGVCQKLADGEEPYAGEVVIVADIMESANRFPYVITPVPIVPDSENRSPDAAEYVVPTENRTLSETEWVNTFVIAARAGATYRVKAIGPTTHGLKLSSSVYTISGKGKRSLPVDANLSGSLDPSFEGWLEFTPIENGNVYVDVSVADGNYGPGKGLEYGTYCVCATLAGCPYVDAGILTVTMRGANEATMAWKILSGSNELPQAGRFYPSGANVALPPGIYTLVAREVAGFAQPLATGFATCEVVAGELTTVTYVYNDLWDPLDDSPDTTAKERTTCKSYIPTQLFPADAKTVVVSRTLWSGDPADWFKIQAKGGCNYSFSFIQASGAPKMTIYGPGNWTNESIYAVVDEQTGDSQIVNAVSGVYYIRISHANMASPIDSSYELAVEVHGDIPVLNSRIVEKRKVEEGRAIGKLPEAFRTMYQFLGWFTESEGGEQISAQTLMGEEDAVYYAHWQFIGRADESTIYINAESEYQVGADGSFDMNLQDLIESLSDPSIFVKGLPTGLKFDAKAGLISGKATKPGVYKVTVSATNASVKKAVEKTFELVVPNLASEKLPGLEPDTVAYGKIVCGVAFDPGLVDCAPEDGWTLKAAGLPTGLKLVQDKMTGAYSITGVPTKAGTFTVTFTASKKGEANQVATITLETVALPEWAVGTFSGFVECYTGPESGSDFGSITMTVAANGKVSGKIALAGTNYTFSAASYAMVNGGDYFVVDAEAKAGKVVRPLRLLVFSCDAPESSPSLLNARVVGSLDSPLASEILMCRGMWKDKATAAAAKVAIAKWEGVYTLSTADGGYLSLTVGKDGNVKASGKLADGTSISATTPLLHDGETGFLACVYSAPSAYKGGSLAMSIGFNEGEGGIRTLGNSRGIAQWTSRNPQATGEYGMGFDREVSFVGAYYNKLDVLRKYYEALRVSFGGGFGETALPGAPALAYTYKETHLNESGKKVTGSESRETEAVDTLGQAGLTAAVNEKGAFVVEKATKPVQDKTTKAWSYDGTNDGAMTLSFTQATGIFKGSYTFWYDYMSAFDATKPEGKQETWTHTSKKVSFEGILVQGESEMRGFYLWDATGGYDDPESGKPKTYKYKESHAVALSVP